jgi:hypothetical protein
VKMPAGGSSGSRTDLAGRGSSQSREHCGVETQVNLAAACVVDPRRPLSTKKLTTSSSVANSKTVTCRMTASERSGVLQATANVRRLRHGSCQGPVADGRVPAGPWQETFSDARPMLSDLGSRKTHPLAPAALVEPASAVDSLRSATARLNRPHLRPRLCAQAASGTESYPCKLFTAKTFFTD